MFDRPQSNSAPHERSASSLTGIVAVVDRRSFVAGLLVTGLCGPALAQQQPADPLPSWNDGAPKRAIIDFVARVTAQGGANFVPADQRIAVFDNDGTLW